MTEAKHTPGNWEWWTSCSWRRLRSDLGHGKTADVLMPTVHRDGQPDIIVSDADMALILVAPKMLALLIRYRMETPLGNQPHMIAAETDAVIAKATGAQ